ncbi:hypothetical protein [Prescottella equi]
MLDVTDRRNCPDWMHIRQFVYLERTSRRVLRDALAPRRVERSNNKRGGTKTINPAGMVTQRFAQRFPIGSRCCLCGVPTIKGETVAYWGQKQFGHALCRVAQWTAIHDAREDRRRRDAQQARQRRGRAA